MLLTVHLARSVVHICFLFGASDFLLARGKQREPSCAQLWSETQGELEFKGGAGGQLFSLLWRWGSAYCSVLIFTSSAGWGLAVACSVLSL